MQREPDRSDKPRPIGGEGIGVTGFGQFQTAQRVRQVAVAAQPAGNGRRQCRTGAAADEGHGIGDAG